MASGLSELLETHRAADATVPEIKQRIGETMAAIMTRLGLKGAGQVTEDLQMGAAQGWPKLEQRVTFDDAAPRNAGAERLLAAFMAVNPADLSFGVQSVTPGGPTKPTYGFNFVAQGPGHIAYAHQLYETMETSLKAIEQQLRL